MNVLVIGGGGREHALCWRIRRDRPDAELFAAPGNGGTADLATNVPIKATDVDGITAWAGEHRPDLVVVGPDDPLAVEPTLPGRDRPALPLDTLDVAVGQHAEHPLGGVDDPAQEAPTGGDVGHLGKLRHHPLALAGGQDDDMNRQVTPLSCFALGGQDSNPL